MWKVRNKKFCSSECWYLYQKEHSATLVTTLFVKRGRETSNTLEAIKKRLRTNFERGHIINWNDNKDWKKYFRECVRLTRLVRKKLIAEWDVYDALDGEYIRHYLDEPHYSKLYPTLDHIVPKSECFRRGLTPREATEESNLQWTKRTNNFKKGSKVPNV